MLHRLRRSRRATLPVESDLRVELSIRSRLPRNRTRCGLIEGGPHRSNEDRIQNSMDASTRVHRFVLSRADKISITNNTYVYILLERESERCGQKILGEKITRKIKITRAWYREVRLRSLLKHLARFERESVRCENIPFGKNYTRDI